MNNDYLLGIGLIAKAVADLLVDKNPALAFTDFFKGLGQFGVHTSIVAAMKAPHGEAAPIFQEPPKLDA